MPFLDSESFLMSGEQAPRLEQQRLSTTDLGGHFADASLHAMEAAATGVRQPESAATITSETSYAEAVAQFMQQTPTSEEGHAPQTT